MDERKVDRRDRPGSHPSRRQFLKGAAVIGGGALVVGCGSSGEGPGGECPAPRVWDRETDVVVIGSGSGLVAALAAAVDGAAVLVLEKSDRPGGSTGMSGGVLWIPNNPVMLREGMADSRDDALAYVRANAMGQAGDDLIEAFVDRGPEMVAFVEAHAPFAWRISELLADYHPEWPGARPHGRSLEPDLPGSSITLGPKLIDGLVEAVATAGGQFLYSTPARRLITREDGEGRREVLGVVAESEGAPIAIRARRGVIMAAGGYDWNEEMKRHFLRGPSKYTLGHPGNTGDGILMGMAAGAALSNMNECWGAVVYKAATEVSHTAGEPAVLMALIQRRMAGSITVNRYGERFCNEAADYDSSWRPFFFWNSFGAVEPRNLPAFQISDAKVKPSATSGRVQADSLRELAGLLGIDQDGLEATVARFNEQAALGADPLFHRGESEYDTHYGPTLAPLDEPPFYGIEVAPADLGTCGGLKVDASARVLDPFGRTIDGLYAAGNNSGVGGPGAGYGGGGGTIGPAMTFAYIAGAHAAARIPPDDTVT